MDTSLALNLIDKYYSEYPLLRSILLTHSQQVCSMALQVVDAHPEWARDKLIDRNFIVQASLLHDIGILFCDASTIHCIGHHPYIEHGFLGAQLLRQEGLERHALVAERHTGSGLTKEDIVMQQINIPIQWQMAEAEIRLRCGCYPFVVSSGRTEGVREMVVQSAFQP